MKKHLLLSLYTLLSLQLTIHAQIITTAVGGGTNYPGDGGLAIDAKLIKPISIAVDAVGNLYICDRDANRVKKVSTDGIITTFAGIGTNGYTGDGGAATAAQLKAPYSIAIDGANNVYFGDQTMVIRKINTSGIISTYAGAVTPGFSGDGGPATAAQIHHPSAIAIDGAGNLFIADFYNSRIRKVDTFGIMTTIAGTGSTLYNGDNIPATDANLFTPTGVAVDNLGNVYIADNKNNRIRKVNTAGIITTVAGTGSIGFTGDGDQATAAKINRPFGVYADNAGNIFISDTYNERIRMINTSGVISTIAGNGLSGYDGDGGMATSAKLSTPMGICLNNTGGMYLAVSDRIRYIDGIVSVNAIDNSEDKGLNIYPNPNEGSFTVSISTTQKTTARMVITDIVGRIIRDIPVTTNQPIELSLEVPNGIYFITAYTKAGIVGGKINILK